MAKNILTLSKNNFGKNFLNKKNFIISVYLLLSIQLGLMSFVIYYLRKNQELYEKLKKYFWGWFILSLVLIIILTFLPMPLYAKILIFTALSTTLGINSFLASQKIPIEVINSAIYSTLGLFIAMTLLGFILAIIGIDLSFLSLVLFISLIALIIGLLVVSFMKVSNKIIKFILVFAIILFSIFVAYDTNVIIQPGYKGDVVDASIGLFLDIINLVKQFVLLDSM